jgi:hypothetical protein
MGETRNAYRFVVESVKERDNLEYVDENKAGHGGCVV